MSVKVPGSYRQVVTLLNLAVLLALLLAACAAPTPAVQPPTPTADDPPTATLAATEPPTPTAEPTAANTPPPAPTEEPTLVPTESLGIGSSRISDIDGMEQVFVPAGEFLMGSTDSEAQTSEDNGRAYPEIPQHTVYLDSYWIDKFEVTNAQYAMCVEAGACQPPFVENSYTYPKYYGNPEFADYPVIWVTWKQAGTYCEWAGRRLLTEAEWEKAARGTEGQKYPWGNDPVTSERANLCDINCTRGISNPLFDDGYPDTAPVGSFPAGASPYGAMDMAGNVWEWVSTLIQPYPYDAEDGREDLEASGERAWRSSPWSNGYWWMRSSVRYRSVPEYKWYVLGIRCASTN